MDESDTGSGRRPRAGESGAPVGSILSIILAVAAVLIGLFILRQIDDDGDGGITTPGSNTTSETDPSTPSDATGPGGSDVPGATATTAPADVRQGATVVIANANTTGGSAVQMNDQFEAAGFKMGSPTNAAGAEVQLDESKVYFTRGNAKARDVATTAARLMGGVEVQRMPKPIPVQDGEIDGEVLVMLGVDAAGKTLDELTAAPGGTVDTTPEVTTSEVTTPTTG